MGSSLSCLPCFRGPAPQSRRYRSCYEKKEFAVYLWNRAEWTCPCCRAEWSVRMSTAQDVEDGVAAPETYQIAEHNGDQIEAWSDGDAGRCLKCDTWWLAEP